MAICRFVPKSGRFKDNLTIESGISIRISHNFPDSNYATKFRSGNARYP